MPNTLAHLGVGGAATRAVINKADLKWAYFACVIPDLPWILQRITHIFIPRVSPYDLRLYVIVQSTLLFSIIFSLAFASLSKDFLKTFLILAFGCLIHLLLDSLQKKWANGAQLFAPFNWSLLNFDLFWPESLPTYLITLFGLFYFLVTFKDGISAPLNLVLKSSKRWIVFATAIVLYSLVPLLILNQPFNADNHFVKTIENVKERPGKYFEVDRRAYKFENGTAILNTFAGEDIELKGINLKSKETLSIRAKFIDEHTAKVIEYHVHSPFFRDGTSYLGLLLVLIFCITAVYKNRKAVFQSQI
jgi:hypothetical protein